MSTSTIKKLSNKKSPPALTGALKFIFLINQRHNLFIQMFQFTLFTNFSLYFLRCVKTGKFT